MIKLATQHLRKFERLQSIVERRDESISTWERQREKLSKEVVEKMGEEGGRLVAAFDQHFYPVLLDKLIKLTAPKSTNALTDAALLDINKQIDNVNARYGQAVAYVARLAEVAIAKNEVIEKLKSREVTNSASVDERIRDIYAQRCKKLIGKMEAQDPQVELSRSGALLHVTIANVSRLRARYTGIYEGITLEYRNTRTAFQVASMYLQLLDPLKDRVSVIQDVDARRLLLTDIDKLDKRIAALLTQDPFRLEEVTKALKEKEFEIHDLEIRIAEEIIKDKWKPIENELLPTITTDSLREVALANINSFVGMLGHMSQDHQQRIKGAADTFEFQQIVAEADQQFSDTSAQFDLLVSHVRAAQILASVLEETNQELIRRGTERVEVMHRDLKEIFPDRVNQLLEELAKSDPANELRDLNRIFTPGDQEEFKRQYSERYDQVKSNFDDVVQCFEIASKMLMMIDGLKAQLEEDRQFDTSRKYTQVYQERMSLLNEQQQRIVDGMRSGPFNKDAILVALSREGEILSDTVSQEQDLLWLFRDAQPTLAAFSRAVEHEHAQTEAEETARTKRVVDSFLHKDITRVADVMPFRKRVQVLEGKLSLPLLENAIAHLTELQEWVNSPDKRPWELGPAVGTTLSPFLGYFDVEKNELKPEYQGLFAVDDPAIQRKFKQFMLLLKKINEAVAEQALLPPAAARSRAQALQTLSEKKAPLEMESGEEVIERVAGSFGLFKRVPEERAKEASQALVKPPEKVSPKPVVELNPEQQWIESQKSWLDLAKAIGALKSALQSETTALPFIDKRVEQVKGAIAKFDPIKMGWTEVELIAFADVKVEELSTLLDRITKEASGGTTARQALNAKLGEVFKEIEGAVKDIAKEMVKPTVLLPPGHEHF